MKNTTNLKGFCFSADTSPLSLNLQEKAIRDLSDDEVLVQNTAIGLNPVDYKLLASFDASRIGQVMGVDGAGIIIASKDPMVKLKARVAYHTNLNYDGSYATHTIVKKQALLYLPNDISDELAAVFPCPALTAMQAFQKVPKLKGKKVLVYGAGGAVGRFLSSFLLLKNAKITAICSPRHHKELLDFGVSECFDYKDFKGKEKAFYAIFDCFGLEYPNDWLKYLSYYGHFVGILKRISANPLPSFGTCVSLHEIALGAIYSYGTKEDFILLQKNAKILFKNINKLLLPAIEIVDFKDIPKTLNRLKSQNEGLKFVAKIS